MAHGLFHGVKHGAVHGIKHQGALLFGGSDPLAGVTRDSTSLKYAPANLAEWNTVLAVAGVGSGPPASVWNMQEASGSVFDSIGSITLGSNMPTYQSSVTGWTRKAIRGTDGTPNQHLINSTTAPNPSLTSTLLMCYVEVPATPPAVRDIMCVQNNADIRYNTTGHLRLVSGAANDLTGAASSVRLVILLTNNTGSVSACFTDQEKFVGTYVLPTNGVLTSFGGTNATNSTAGFMYGCEFTGASAELSSATLKTILQTLGWTIPWS